MRQRLGSWNPFHLRPIPAPMAVLRVEELEREGAFIAQEKKAFRFRVESTHPVHAKGKAELFESSPPRTGFGELRDNAVGFMKSDEHVEPDGCDRERQGC